MDYYIDPNILAGLRFREFGDLNVACQLSARPNKFRLLCGSGCTGSWVQAFRIQIAIAA